MKKISNLMFAGCLAAVLFLNFGIASANKGPEGNGDKADHKEMNRLGGMKEKLGLTDEQAAKMKDIWKSQQETMKSLRDQERVDMALLRQKVDAKASDSEIRTVLDKLSADRKAIQEAQESMTKKMKSILTPTQQAKMLLGVAHHMEGMRGGMKEKMKEKKADRKKHKKESLTTDTKDDNDR